MAAIDGFVNSERPALDVLKHGQYYKKNTNDPEKAEYFIRVDWIDTVPETKAINEVGLFGNKIPSATHRHKSGGIRWSDLSHNLRKVM